MGLLREKDEFYKMYFWFNFKDYLNLLKMLFKFLWGFSTPYKLLPNWAKFSFSFHFIIFRKSIYVINKYLIEHIHFLEI